MDTSLKGQQDRQHAVPSWHGVSNMGSCFYPRLMAISPRLNTEITDLRTYREKETSKHVYKTAMRLFSTKSFESTTVADIAMASGVSRRTIYRYFGTKIEIPFFLPNKWLEYFQSLTETRPTGISCYDFCHEAVCNVARFIETDTSEVLLAFQILADIPAFRVRHALKNREWMELYTTLIYTDLTLTASLIPEKELTIEKQQLAAVLAGALMGGTDQTLFAWLKNPEISLLERTQSLLRDLDPLWPALTKIRI